MNMEEQMNKGTGAGGANTNVSGLAFEDKTDNSNHLQAYKDFTIVNKHFYPTKKEDNKQIIFLPKKYFKPYMSNRYNIKMFRIPDESYIIERDDGTKKMIIIEKKNQTNEGSVETKLWSGPSLKREYELFLGKDYKVEYIFCVSHFLKQKINSDNEKYKILNIILKEHNIPVFCGDDEDYFEKINQYLTDLFNSS